MQFQIFDHDAFLLVLTSGDATLEGFDRMNEAIRVHPAFSSTRPVLIDHSAANFSTLASTAVTEIADRARDRNPWETRRAIVCPDPLGYGLARMWWGNLDEMRQEASGIFRSREEAERWLLGDQTDQ